MKSELIFFFVDGGGGSWCCSFRNRWIVLNNHFSGRAYEYVPEDVKLRNEFIWWIIETCKYVVLKFIVFRQSKFIHLFIPNHQYQDTFLQQLWEQTLILWIWMPLQLNGCGIKCCCVVVGVVVGEAVLSRVFDAINELMNVNRTRVASPETSAQGPLSWFQFTFPFIPFDI